MNVVSAANQSPFYLVVRHAIRVAAKVWETHPLFGEDHTVQLWTFLASEVPYMVEKQGIARTICAAFGKLAINMQAKHPRDSSAS